MTRKTYQQGVEDAPARSSKDLAEKVLNKFNSRGFINCHEVVVFILHELKRAGFIDLEKQSKTDKLKAKSGNRKSAQRKKKVKK